MRDKQIAMQLSSRILHSDENVLHTDCLHVGESVKQNFLGEKSIAIKTYVARGIYVMFINKLNNIHIIYKEDSVHFLISFSP
jgi:hypothetical protein